MLRFLSIDLRTEARANLRLALPLIGAQLANVGMGSVDAAFAGRLGPDALAAVAVGVNLNVVFLVFAMGVFMACSPIVAQLRGAGRPAAQGAIFLARGRRLAWMVGLVWCLALNLLAAPVLGALGLDAQTTRVAIEFERWLSFSAFGFSLWFALRFVAEGAGVVRPILVAGLAGLAANALLDWLLLFGHWGWPALGAPGCGVATTLSTLLMAGVLQLSYRRAPRLAPYRAAPRAQAVAADAPGMREVLRLGLPIALILLAEAGAFVVCALATAHFGAVAVGAYQIAINIASLAFMIPLGIAQATTVRVGLAAGAGDAAAVRFRGAAGMGLALANAGSNVRSCWPSAPGSSPPTPMRPRSPRRPCISCGLPPRSSSSTACRSRPTAPCAGSRTRACLRRSRSSLTGWWACRWRMRWPSAPATPASAPTACGGD